MIDLKTETIISLAQAAKRLPPGRCGRPVNFSTLYRWAFRGVKTPDGSLVRLEILRLGGRFLTSLEAIQRFANAQTPQAGDAPPLPRTRTEAQRRRASEAARKELEKLGV